MAFSIPGFIPCPSVGPSNLVYLIGYPPGLICGDKEDAKQNPALFERGVQVIYDLLYRSEEKDILLRGENMTLCRNKILGQTCEDADCRKVHGLADWVARKILIQGRFEAEACLHGDCWQFDCLDVHPGEVFIKYAHHRMTFDVFPLQTPDDEVDQIFERRVRRRTTQD